MEGVPFHCGTMISTSAAFGALFLIVGLNAIKLTVEENERLQKTCGVNMKEVYRYSRKVLNGTAAHAGESPWSVAVYLTDAHAKTVYTTGTLISDLHILTYDSIFLTNSTDGIRFRDNMDPIGTGGLNCEGHNLVLPKHVVRKTSVFLDMLRADRFSGKDRLSLRKVTVVGGCKRPFRLNRLAVVELTKAVTAKQKARPICIAASVPTPSYTFYGYGDNRGDVMDATLRHTKLSLTPCPVPSKDIFCVTAQNPLCNGDFGGAAARRIADTVQAFGVYIDGPFECAQLDENAVFTFANLTAIARSVCSLTGVCGESTLVTTTTTTAPTSGTTTSDVEREEEEWPDVEIGTKRVTNSDVIENDSESGSVTKTGSAHPESSEADNKTTAYSIGTGVGVEETRGTSSKPSGETGSQQDGFTGTGSPVACPVKSEDETDNDIHITIKLAKYRKTGDPKDIVHIFRGPKSYA
ncbi:unnamed protein product [Caenorhabditis sp. 36 PRJEB53466]|nr:unnamed protein product [Caenorhabditis sp. 36 PRJEB53466]